MPADPSGTKKRRHRFQKIDERLQNLQAELQLQAKTTGISESSLTFQEELVLQAELTTIDEFQLLFRKLQPLVTTTPQLLHHLPKVVALLRQELEEEHAEEIQTERIVPVLKLLTALARELRKEFYPHFANVLPQVVAIIDTKNPELSTQVFKTLTMLFTILRVQILKDMDAVHKCYFPLLGHPKAFVRDFAAQTLSILLRRIDNVKDLKKYLSTYLKALTRGSGRENEVLHDGTAKLFFALMRNVNHGFHSRMSDILLFLLGAFRPKDDSSASVEDTQRVVVYNIVSSTCNLLIKHTDAEHATEILDCFAVVLNKLATLKRETSADCLYVSRMISIFQQLVRHRFGKLIADDKQILVVHQICAKLLTDPSILASPCVELRENLVQLYEMVWRLFPDDSDVVGTQVQAFFSSASSGSDEELKRFWRNRLLSLTEQMLNNTHVQVDFIKTILIPNAIRMAYDTLINADVGAFATLICQIGRFVAANQDELEESEYLYFSMGQCFLTHPVNPHQSTTHETILLHIARKLLHECVKSGDEDEDGNNRHNALALAWKFCRAVALIRIDFTEMLSFVKPAIAQLDKEMRSDEVPADIRAALGAIRAELWRLMQVAENQKDVRQGKTKATKHAKNFVQIALACKETSYATLSTLLEFIQMKTKRAQRELLEKESLEPIVGLLMANLRSPSHALRLVSLEILARYERFDFVEGEDAVLTGECDLLDIGVDLERLCENVGVETEREIVRLLGRVKILSRSRQTPIIYKMIAVNHLLGLYHVKFATIWPHIADAIEAAARLHFAEIWQYVSNEILKASLRQDECSTKEQSTLSLLSRSKATEEEEPLPTFINEFSAVCALEMGKVDPASVTDLITHHSLVWKGLEKFSDLVETKTKFIVPVFLTFLRDQYTAIYADELDTTKLKQIDQLLAKVATSDAPNWEAKRVFVQLTTKTVRNKFLDQLKLFATFKNMKGAYAQAFLHDFFFDLLMKSDEVVSKLALRCLYCFGKKHLSAYKEQLNRIVDSATFREELTNFNISEDAGVVLREHRAQLLPVLMRILYSKCVSKKGRNSGDTVAARRAAILSYLAGLDVSELASFVELVVRAFNVKIDVPESNGDKKSATQRQEVVLVPLENVQPSRILGFLNLLEDLIAQLGVKLVNFAPIIANLLVSILHFNVRTSDDFEAEEADDVTPMDVDEEQDEQSKDHTKSVYSVSMKKQVRVLTYRRLAELIDTFDSLVNLKPWIVTLLETSHEAITRLPNVMVGADKTSALLDMLVALARADSARTQLTQPLILNVISCLSAGLSVESSDTTSRGISYANLDAVLQFMGSLLDGDESMDTFDSEIARQEMLLIPHIPFILNQFVIRFQLKAARYVQDRYVGSSKKELVFLCRLSHHLDATSEALSSKSAHDLFQLLLPFLQRNHHSSPADMENILEVLTQLVPLLSEPKKHVLALSKLLAPGPNCISDRSPREKLVGVFVALGNHETLKDLAPVASLLESLNAYETKKIEEMDFERRMDALNRVNQSEFAGFLHEPHLLGPLISQYLQSMHDAEFSIRSGALSGLSTFVRLIAESIKADPATAEKSPATNALESLVMPCVRVSLKSSSEDIRRGFVTLLGNLSDYHTAFCRFSFVHADLSLVRNQEDPEADFFYNITHIQAHRKRRALQRLGNVMNTMALKIQTANNQEEDKTERPETKDVFSNSTVNNIILPLVLHFIYETQAKSQESIRVEAAACVGSAAGLLGWSHYLALLRRLLKSIDGHEEMENSIIATVCAVIDHFHFEAPGAIVNWESSRTQRNAIQNNKDTIEDTGASKIQDNMEVQVLPMMKKYLFKGVTEKGKAKAAVTSFDDEVVSSQAVTVRVPLALAIVKVLRRLRAATFYMEFPKLLMSFTKLLKSKDESIRSSARTTLVRITTELGITYLFPVVEELKHTLRDGYMVHVLSYTLHSILEKVSTMVEAKKPRSLTESNETDQSQAQDQDTEHSSPLDACIPSMMQIILEEMFRGTIENQDGSEQYKSKMKEAKSSRSYDSIELLARSMPFLPNPTIHTVISNLVKKFQENENAKSILVLQEALKRIALGLAKNPSVDRSYVFLYVYNVLNSCLESIRPLTDLEKDKYSKATAGISNSLVSAWQVNEKSKAASAELAKRVRARDAAKVELQARMTGFDRHQIQEESESLVHIEELLNFAVFLVYAFIRSGDISPSLVDPLVPHLMRCAAEVKNNKTVINALKCLSVLLNHHSLPSMDVALTPLVDRLFKIIQKAGAATRNEMVQTCYRTLTMILKHRTEYKLTEPQLRVLLSFVRADLDEKDHQNATYALLKSIIASRLVISEVYDVMLRVGELLVQSDAQSARSNCSSIYIMFLLEYPLGPKRITEHLKFLVQNLSYTYESGRKSVLEALAVVVKKLPVDIVNDRVQFFFLPLVLRVANEESVTCRALAADVIKTLIRRIGNQQLNETVQLLQKWWQTARDAKLLSTAAQVTSLVLESRPEFIEKGVVEMFMHANKALHIRLQEMKDAPDNAAIDWQVVYHILVCLTTSSNRITGTTETWLATTKEGTQFMDGVVLPILEEYPHAWVRLAALRFVNSYLRRRSEKTLTFSTNMKKLSKNINGDEYLKKPNKLFAVAFSICKVMERSQLSSELADETLVAMPFLCAALAANGSIPQYLNDVDSPQTINTDAEIETNEEDQNDADAVDNSESDKETHVNTTTTRTTEGEGQDEQAKAKTPLGWILTRLSYVCRTADVSVQTTIFKLFAALIHAQDNAFVEKFLMQMLNPLYRSATSTLSEQKDPPSESALLAQEVLELLERKVGSTVFLDAYTFVQKQLAHVRAQRKQKRKHDLVNNSELAAKRKIQKNEQKRRAKQLKKRKYTVMKGTASQATRPKKIMRPGAE